MLAPSDQCRTAPGRDEGMRISRREAAGGIGMV